MNLPNNEGFYKENQASDFVFHYTSRTISGLEDISCRDICSAMQ
jgi:hypothetical protein